MNRSMVEETRVSPLLHPQCLVDSPNAQRKAIRVLHIVESLDNQAIESWLLRVLSASRREYPFVNWTLFCVLVADGKLDQAAQRLGAEVIHSRYEVGDKIRFIRSLREVMKRGRYDILHCHHDIMSAAYLVASIGLPFKKRIVHSHNTSMSLPTPSRVKAELAREPMRQICLRMADQIVGISTEALQSLIGNGSVDPLHHRVVHYAVDTNRFSQASVERHEFRRKLGFSPTAKVLLFVGRMVEYKNPLFVIEILERLAQIDSDTVAVFVGSGDQENAVRELGERKDLNGRVRLLGFRDDVPELLLGSDVMIWPSLEEPMEGLGLGIIEAQAAGLPILMSRSVPEEAIVVSELVTVLPLAAGPEAWADRVSEILKQPHLDRIKSCVRVESSSFSMTAGVRNMMTLYEDTV